MLETVLSFLSSEIIYPLVIPGFIAGVLLILVGFFTPNALLKYKAAFFVLGVLAILFFTYYDGKQDGEAKWKDEINKQKIELADLRTRRAEVTTNVVIKYVDRIQYVDKVRTEFVNVIHDAVTPKIDTDFPLPNVFVRLHDDSVQGRIPEPTRESDAEASSVKVSGAITSITDNYDTCRKNSIQLESLQEWIKQQKSIH